MTQKVKLPREVAEAIEELREKLRKEKIEGDAFILWRSTQTWSIDNENWKILHRFTSQSDNIFLLADALRYGYTIDEPITVTITTEIQDELQRFYRDQFSVQGVRANVIRTTLNILNIKIPGIND